MRRVRYAVAVSLDGFIAGPKGEADWITMDPDIDFKSIFDEFDTFLIGRRTFETFAHAGHAPMPGTQTFVFSRTLRQSDYPKVTIVSDNLAQTIDAIRTKPGKDIWLFGGGSLFASLVAENMVDTVEVAVVPVLLGAGIPLLPTSGSRVNLKLTGHKIYESGVVSLQYDIVRTSGRRRSTRERAGDRRGSSQRRRS